MSGLTVFTFSAGFGLPTTGPFALKLLKWLDLAGIPYVQKYEDNPGKGPKGKNPWIELDGNRIGDTEIIIDLLARRHGFDIDAGLSRAPLAAMPSAHARGALPHGLNGSCSFTGWRRAHRAKEVAAVAPPVVAGAVTSMFRGHFHNPVHARGIARHADEVIRAKGIDDMQALEALLGDRDFLGGDHPVMADVSAYGLVAPMAFWPMRTPVADYIKTRPALQSYMDRMRTAKRTLASAA